MTRTALLDYELVVPIFSQGHAFLAWGDFHAHSRFARSLHYSLGKTGTTRSDSQSTALRADQTTYDPKRLRWNREQECENYGAEKTTRGRMTERKGKSYEENLE